MSKQPLNDILSGVSAYINEVIDDRLELRYSTTVLAPAIREEISRIIDSRITRAIREEISGAIDARIADVVSGPGFQTMIEKAVEKHAVQAPELARILEQTMKSRVKNMAEDAVYDCLEQGEFKTTFSP